MNYPLPYFRIQNSTDKFPNSFTMVEHQVLEERYVDKAKLIALLRRLFGDGKFEIEEVWQSTLEDMIVPALTSRSCSGLGRTVPPYSP